MHPRRKLARRPWRQFLFATLSCCTLACTGAASGPASAPSSTPPVASTAKARAPAQKGPRSFTLISGDVVRFDAATDQLSLRTSPARKKITFSVERSPRHLYVIPSDALPLLQKGVLDRGLFDLRALARFDHDDVQRTHLPLLFTYAPSSSTSALSHPTANTRAGVTLKSLHGQALQVPKVEAKELWASLTGRGGASVAGLKKIWLDGKRKVVDDVSNPQIGAPAAWAAGYTGKGITVAVIDTGIDASHPDLAGKVIAHQDFTGTGATSDTFGHGTHVASIIAGTGAASGGQYKGVAPDATLIDATVCAGDSCDDSAILAGMEWAVNEQHAKIVNMSLGGEDTPDLDPLEEAVNTLSAQTGVLFVVAAGNDGLSGASTVGSPGSADAALTVGAVDSHDVLADFSSRGPRVGDEAIKPDVTAPGVNIIAALAQGVPPIGTVVGTQYQSLSGTSMATPHVAGSAALLLQEHPAWKQPELKGTLVASAKPNSVNTVFEQGAGRIDLTHAITESVVAEPSSLSLGVQQWPHGDDAPILSTLTYENTSSAAVTLTLAVDVHAPSGVVPAGMFSLSAQSVSVPAHGTKAITLTTDTRVNGADGWYQGDVVATAGAQVLRTPLAVEREVESYSLTVQAPVDSVSVALKGLDPGSDKAILTWYDPVKTLRVPAGNYWLHGEVDSADPDGSYVATSIDVPVLQLRANKTVTLDPSTARPVMLSIPDAQASDIYGELGTVRLVGGTPYSFASLYLGFANIRYQVAQLGADVPVAEESSYLFEEWSRLDANGSADGTTDLDAAMLERQGGQLTGVTRKLQPGELATVDVTFRNQVAGAAYFKDLFAQGALASTQASISLAYPPGTKGHTEHLFGTPGARWGQSLDEISPDFSQIYTELEHVPVPYTAGVKQRDVLGNAVFSPTLPVVSLDVLEVTRTGDHLVVDLPLFGDGSGGIGVSAVDSSLTSLYRNGRKLADSEVMAGYGEFDLPPASSRYRLELDAQRSISDLSTRVTTTFNFTSQHETSPTPVKMPVSVIRFAPELDASNSAEAGRPLVIPISLERQPGAPAAHAPSLQLKTSFDDGKSWRQALTLKIKGSFYGLVFPPQGAKFASLQAVAEDTNGDSVTQTVVHAFRLR